VFFVYGRGFFVFLGGHRHGWCLVFFLVAMGFLDGGAGVALLWGTFICKGGIGFGRAPLGGGWREGVAGFVTKHFENIFLNIYTDKNQLSSEIIFKLLFKAMIYWYLISFKHALLPGLPLR
jgi:hypothetical protein